MRQKILYAIVIALAGGVSWKFSKDFDARWSE